MIGEAENASEYMVKCLFVVVQNVVSFDFVRRGVLDVSNSSVVRLSRAIWSGHQYLANAKTLDNMPRW